MSGIVNRVMIAFAVQLDAKRHYPDGSVKHGVVSLLVPKLEGAARLEFFAEEPAENRPASIDQAAKGLLDGDFEATVSFAFPAGGKPVAASIDEKFGPLHPAAKRPRLEPEAVQRR